MYAPTPSSFPSRNERTERMPIDDLVRNDDAGAFERGERPASAEAIRAMVRARVPRT